MYSISIHGILINLALVAFLVWFVVAAVRNWSKFFKNK
ncbi:hypothetical protein SAMN06264849_11080 [Melghirimyces algeriensis]|uniref:Uncharacterized protein n=1 Tax=Melghirimyces algeriensis TaxID=910412 RepID=A0A521ERJ5_9BACL|nr:hypothetical protein SAMN06264849_11080 [Melghirimyces algeriensis]